MYEGIIRKAKPLIFSTKSHAPTEMFSSDHKTRITVLLNRLPLETMSETYFSFLLKKNNINKEQAKTLRSRYRKASVSFKNFLEQNSFTFILADQGETHCGFMTESASMSTSELLDEFYDRNRHMEDTLSYLSRQEKGSIEWFTMNRNFFHNINILSSENQAVLGMPQFVKKNFIVYHGNLVEAINSFLHSKAYV